MKRFYRYLLAAAAATALLAAGAVIATPRAGVAAGADTPPEHTLSVLGRAIVEAVPDAARVTVGINETAATAAESYGQASKVMDEIVGAMAARGIDKKDMQTSGLSLYPEYRYDKEGKQHLVGFRTNANLTITTRQLAKIGGLADAAVAAGANQIQGIEFFVWNTDAFVNQALDKAVDDAKAKAERVAARLGAKVAGVASVNVMDDAAPPTPVAYKREMLAAPADAGMPVLPGTSRMQVAVQVTFVLTP